LADRSRYFPRLKVRTDFTSIERFLFSGKKQMWSPLTPEQMIPSEQYQVGYDRRRSKYEILKIFELSYRSLATQPSHFKFPARYNLPTCYPLIILAVVGGSWADKFCIGLVQPSDLVAGSWTDSN